MNPLLALKKVTHFYGSRCVLRDISLELFPGEIVACIGQSGSGKSTLLHLAGLLEKPSEGSLFWQGSLVPSEEDKRAKQRAQSIGFVYQSHCLLPDFSAQENIALGAILSGFSQKEAFQEADLWLEKIQLTAQKEQKPSQLSGGEQQRVALARALIARPALLLADEPTGNLDPQMAEAFFQTWLTWVRASNSALLLVTHDWSLACKADRTFVLNQGSLIQKSDSTL